MKPLSAKARALVDVGRKAYRPRIGDRERIEAALRARLGTEALPPDVVHAQGARWLRPGIMLGTGIVVVGVASILTIFRAEEAPLRAPTAPVVEQQLAPEAPPPAPAPSPQSPPPERPSAPAQGPAAARPDPLKQELALLTRAARNMNAGHAGKALAVLAEHERRFPHGALEEERHVAQAQALCALGRTSEARAQQALLQQGSLAAERAGRACGSAHEK